MGVLRTYTLGWHRLMFVLDAEEISAGESHIQQHRRYSISLTDLPNGSPTRISHTDLGHHAPPARAYDASSPSRTHTDLVLPMPVPSTSSPSENIALMRVTGSVDPCCCCWMGTMLPPTLTSQSRPNAVNLDWDAMISRREKTTKPSSSEELGDPNPFPFPHPK